MALCVIAQPIHPVGAELLRAAGIDVLQSTGAEAFAQELASADAAIVRDGVSAAQLDGAPRLLLVANHGTGTDKIDVAHAHSIGIAVSNTPLANVRAVAEHTLYLMLAAAHQAVTADAATRAGNWRFKYEGRMVSLYDKTLGIVGFGRIGELLCGMAGRGLGMRVLVWSPRADALHVRSFGAEVAASFEQLLAQSDVISLHRPLRPDTAHTIDASALSRMKRDAIVVNTSRGGLIDETALVDALRAGRIGGAGLDVFEQEPLSPASPLATLANVVLSPHIAGSSQEALQATATQCAGQVIAALSGQQPESLLDPSVWGRRGSATRAA
ncbi:hydroxyacid dehydrogenase [Herbaspirillum chlorophenolicum]|uniref:hydroxyacid dehydrogenase n=1 Tax=Herbaspirillum chlorophenolicum TaxID=211589 RepID=UPI00067CFB68|nr:hydroxyacid dehydrogenase [Herbaspirillum chlorophenolicum]